MTRFKKPLMVRTKKGYILKCVGFDYRVGEHRDKRCVYWFSHCVDCGAEFQQWSGLARYPELRRCEKHRRGIKYNPQNYPTLHGEEMLSVIEAVLSVYEDEESENVSLSIVK